MPNLDSDDAMARLADHDHAVLCTLHAKRGVDAVPCVYAIDDERHVGIPVDTVKSKTSTRLQRQRNLEADPRAVLLAEHWDAEDWSRLWWVRAELRWLPDPSSGRVDGLAEQLVQRYRPYRDRPFAEILVLRIVGLRGWIASATDSV